MLADMHVSATLAVSKAWQKQKQAAGWACMHWPVQAGGHGASLIERVLRQQEEGVHGKLAGIFIIGQGMIAHPDGLCRSGPAAALAAAAGLGR